MFAAAKSEDPGLLECFECGSQRKDCMYDDKTAFDYARENPAIRNSDAYWLLNDARF